MGGKNSKNQQNDEADPMQSEPQNNKPSEARSNEPQNNKPSEVQRSKETNQRENEVQPRGCCSLKRSKKGTGGETASRVSRTNKSRITTNENYRTGKSSVMVKKIPNARIDDKLFEGREKEKLEIRLKRQQPYELLKDEDYFDSQMEDKHDLNKIKKSYDTCEIANYQTPDHEKLQTVQVKTYLFDRNLTKIRAA